MTIHQSKGLEFPYVFLVGCNEGVMPSQRCVSELRRQGLEEERRLAYVAVTRAKRQLYITDNEGAYYGGGNRVPSRFIFEIDDSRVKRINRVPEYLVSMTQSIIQSECLDDDIAEEAPFFTVGTRVRHRAFGLGTVEKVDTVRNEYLIRMDKNDYLMSIRMDFTGLTAADATATPDVTTPASTPAAADATVHPAPSPAAADTPARPQFAVGDPVNHPLFGPGRVTAVDIPGGRYSVYINQGGFTVPVNFGFDGLKPL